MATPRFEEAFENHGFDRNATPRWQMVALGSSLHSLKDVNLRFAAGMNVVSQIPNVATITKDSTSSSGDRFTIEAKNPGTTFIDVFDPGSQTLFPKRLEVEVKNIKRVKIAYQFVDKTTYNPTEISNQVHQNLTLAIYEPQANVHFDLTRATPISVIESLRGIISELKSRRPRKEWFGLIDWGDKGADINVFFMPWDGRAEERPTEMLAEFNVDKGGFNIVCPDGMSLREVERALAHEIGFFLGCSAIHNDRQRNHLMFRASNDRDLTEFVQSGDYMNRASRRLRDSRFISKDCANWMNPTFSP
jgi:hypothetical protein